MSASSTTSSKRGVVGRNLLQHEAHLGAAIDADRAVAAAILRLGDLLTDDAQQGRLARAVAPDEADFPAIGNLRRSPLEQGPAVDPERKVVDLEHGLAGRSGTGRQPLGKPPETCFAPPMTASPRRVKLQVSRIPSGAHDGARTEMAMELQRIFEIAALASLGRRGECPPAPIRRGLLSGSTHWPPSGLSHGSARQTQPEIEDQGSAELGNLASRGAGRRAGVGGRWCGQPVLGQLRPGGSLQGAAPWRARAAGAVAGADHGADRGDHLAGLCADHPALPEWRRRLQGRDAAGASLCGAALRLGAGGRLFVDHRDLGRGGVGCDVQPDAGRLGAVQAVRAGGRSGLAAVHQPARGEGKRHDPRAHRVRLPHHPRRPDRHGPDGQERRSGRARRAGRTARRNRGERPRSVGADRHHGHRLRRGRGHLYRYRGAVRERAIPESAARADRRTRHGADCCVAWACSRAGSCCSTRSGCRPWWTGER